VVRLREAEPPMAQTLINSFTDAMTNCEFIFSDVTEESLATKR
jgi:hypothetical protein